MIDDKYYQMISRHYGDKKANRSGVPYMSHINEGMILCEHLGYSLEVKQAFCLHPMFQSDPALEETYKQEWIKEIDPLVMCFTMEYRKTANSYLSFHNKTAEQIVLSAMPEVNQMLIVDKIQNRKDFEVYHLGRHERSTELDQYFKNWLKRLGISEKRYQSLKNLIHN